MSAYRAITQRHNAMGLRWTDSCTCPKRANSFAVNKYLLLRRYQSPLIDGERPSLEVKGSNSVAGFGT